MSFALRQGFSASAQLTLGAASLLVVVGSRAGLSVGGGEGWGWGVSCPLWEV